MLIACGETVDPEIWQSYQFGSGFRRPAQVPVAKGPKRSVGGTQPPPYYIFDTHAHLGFQGRVSKDPKTNDPVGEKAPGQNCSDDDQAAMPGGLKICSNGRYYYDYPLMLQLVEQNMHCTNTIDGQCADRMFGRTMALSPSKARPSGYSSEPTLCLYGGSSNCELNTPFAFLPPDYQDNEFDVRMLAGAASAAFSRGDPDAVHVSMAGFGCCDTNASLSFVQATAPSFRWAGEMDNNCFSNAVIGLSNNNFPTSQAIAIAGALRNWDTEHHGTVLSTHLDPGGGWDFAYFVANDACRTGDSRCEHTVNAVRTLCGQGLALHMTHANKIVDAIPDDPSYTCDWAGGQGVDSLQTLKMLFSENDDLLNGFFFVELQQVWNPQSSTDHCGGGPNKFCVALATATPQCVIDWLLDPLVSRHITIGSHTYGSDNFEITDFSSKGVYRMGINYGHWKAYWDEIFGRMYQTGGNSAAACEAVQNIAHGNVERLLRIPPIPGYGCEPPYFVAGLGPDAGNPAQFRAYRYDAPLSLSTNGHKRSVNGLGSDSYGLNVAAGTVEAVPTYGSAIVTAPGPGPTLGSLVRGWDWSGNLTFGATQLPGFDFFAYNAQMYGANVTTADVDGDGIDEILTGSGPGGFNGPTVRGWIYTGAGVMAIPGINYAAYSGYFGGGVYVGVANVDGDAYDEILTGEGPVQAAGTKVKAWDWDGGTSNPPAMQFSFDAYPQQPPGVTVAGGDFDGDGTDEIATGPGPANLRGSELKMYDGTTFLADIAPGFTTGGTYGVFVGSVYVPECGAGPCNALLGGQGPDPNAATQVKGFRYDGTNSIKEITDLDLNAFSSNRTYGATVAGVPVDEPFTLGAGARAGGGATLGDRLVTIRNLIGMTPDSKTVDPMIDPDADIDINVWQQDVIKKNALDTMDSLIVDLAKLRPPEIIARLQVAEDWVEAGLLNKEAAEAVTEEIEAAIATQSGK